MADDKGLVPYSYNRQLSPKAQSAAAQWLEGQSEIARSALAKRWQIEHEKQSAIAALYAHVAQRYRQARDIAWAEMDTIYRPEQQAEYAGFLATTGDSLTRILTEEAERGARNIAAIADAFGFVPPTPSSRRLTPKERLLGRTQDGDD
jgi:hypothetical protein